jgi:hypothetical protein
MTPYGGRSFCRSPAFELVFKDDRTRYVNNPSYPREQAGLPLGF